MHHGGQSAPHDVSADDATAPVVAARSRRSSSVHHHPAPTRGWSGLVAAEEEIDDEEEGATSAVSPSSFPVLPARRRLSSAVLTAFEQDVVARAHTAVQPT
jgi:hypothetical protein